MSSQRDAGDGQEAFNYLVEIDNSTEPVYSTKQRDSLARKIPMLVARPEPRAAVPTSSLYPPPPALVSQENRSFVVVTTPVDQFSEPSDSRTRLEPGTGTWATTGPAPEN